jgi:hypothetical protein
MTLSLANCCTVEMVACSTNRMRYNTSVVRCCGFYWFGLWLLWPSLAGNQDWYLVVQEAALIEDLSNTKMGTH